MRNARGLLSTGLARRDAAPPRCPSATHAAGRRRARLTLACLLLPLTMHVGKAGATIGDTMPAPAGVRPGDPQVGRAIVTDRQLGFCLLCHSGPFPEVRQQGNLAPSLAGAAGRWTTEQLRLRITDNRRLNPDSIMPSYGVADQAPMIAVRQRGVPLLTAQQIEDITAFLATLKE